MEKQVRRLLLVEDEAAHAELIRRALESEEDLYEVAVAGTLAEARRHLSVAFCDLVILDWQLPDGKGLELLPGDKEELDYPILVMTAYGDEGTAVAALKAGALDYVVKSEQVFGAMGDIVRRLLREWDQVIKRRRAEAALQESERKYRTLAETTTAAIFIYRGEQILEVNAASEVITGYPRKELLDMKFWELIHKDHRDLAIMRIQSRQRQKSVQNRYEVKLRNKRGEERWVDFSAEEIVYQGAAAVLGTAIDITQRKRIEKAYRRSETSYRSLVEGSPDIVWSFSDKQGTRYVSQRVRGILGYEPEYLYQHPWLWNESIHPDDRERVAQAIAEFAQGKPVDVEYRIKDSIGEWRWLHDRSIDHRQEGEETIMDGISTDITERKQVEKALQESEKKLIEAQALAHLGHWVLDIETLEVIGSDELFRIFELTHDEATLDGFAAVVHPEDREYDLSHIRRGMETGESWDIEHRLLMKDGRVKWVHAIGEALTDEKGNIFQLVGTVHDITERKRTTEQLHRQELEQAQTAKLSSIGLLASELSHELNQPLSAITNYAQACRRLLEQEEVSADVRQAVENIHRQGMRAGKIMKSIKDFVRSREPKFQAININQIIQNLMETYQVKAQREAVQLNLELAERIPEVPADGVQIEQVLTNLLNNSFEALADCEHLQREINILTTQIDNKYVEVTVRDTGRGFAEEAAEKVFEPFYTSKPEGTGIGLTLSRSIILAHQGRLWAQANEKQGVTFRFTLPTGIM